MRALQECLQNSRKLSQLLYSKFSKNATREDKLWPKPWADFWSFYQWRFSDIGPKLPNNSWNNSFSWRGEAQPLTLWSEIQGKSLLFEPADLALWTDGDASDQSCKSTFVPRIDRSIILRQTLNSRISIVLFGLQWRGCISEFCLLNEHCEYFRVHGPFYQALSNKYQQHRGYFNNLWNSSSVVDPLVCASCVH